MKKLILLLQLLSISLAQADYCENLAEDLSMQETEFNRIENELLSDKEAVDVLRQGISQSIRLKEKHLIE